MRRSISFLIVSAFLFLQVLPYLPASIQNTPLIYTLKKGSVFNPPEIVDAAGLSSASATLSNPRLSFHGLLNVGVTAGGSVVVVKGSGTGGDFDTRNLFPNDNVLITGNSAISVASIAADLVTFTLTSPTTVTAAADANMTVAQNGTLTVAFYTAAPIPLGGSIKISVPATATAGNDGVPLSATSIAASGFDTNGMTNANTTCPGGFTAGTFTTGTGGAAHTFTCNNAGGAVPAGANITFVIGNTIGLVNPAPIIGHVRGVAGIVADIYNIVAATYSGTSGAGSLIEDLSMKTAPVEGVLVTATVDETLQFTIAGQALGSTTICGVAHVAGLTTTATAVPWGTISSGYSADKNEAAQKLTITTNASDGYKVYAEQNDQMGLEGNICSGTAPSSGEYTFGASSCIRDAHIGTGVTTPSSVISADWGANPGTNYGFGYSLTNSSGTDAKFTYSTVYQAKHFADMEAGENKYAIGAEVMTNAGPVSASAVFVCYRINIPATQPAGYYYNKLKYTAVAKF